MKIIKVSVTVQRTVSLPEYSNVRFGLSLDADVEDEFNKFESIDMLREKATAYVEEQCNQALEQEGQPAKFYEGELYDVVLFLDHVLIVQHGVEPAMFPANYHKLFTGHRYSGAETLANREAKKRGLSVSTLIGETEALQAKMVEIAEHCGAIAVVETGHIVREGKTVHLLAMVPLSQVLFSHDYHLFRDRAQVEDHIAHDWRKVELVEVQTAEELESLLSVADDEDDEDD